MTVALACGLTGCAGASQDATADAGRIRELVRDMTPKVERAVGLTFRAEPGIAVRSEDDVRSYLIHKLDNELPPEELERLVLAYRLFGMIPDTLDMRALLLDLYLEQVVGYYDPDSSALYVVRGANETTLSFTLAHELVHALQDQYLALDSLLSLKRQNDRRMAAQAVLEGQATVASLLVVAPSLGAQLAEGSWNDYWRAVREQHKQMPVFNEAPLVIREGLVFPYLAGGQFISWFMREYPDTVPFGARLPTSTEQVLHPERYRRGDVPVALAFRLEEAFYEDGLGEFETRILLTTLTGSDSIASRTAHGWGGDRYAVLTARDGHALVWWTVWDTAPAADRFAGTVRERWTVAAPRRIAVERTSVGDLPAVLVVMAPEGWEGWDDVPEVEVR